VEPLAAHEKIFIDGEIAEDENHGELGCEECHGGDPGEPDWRKAHIGVVKDPSYPDPSNACGVCHEAVAENYNTSLHVTLLPMKHAIDIRADSEPSVYQKVDAAREGHCNSCHSSCGQCHISRPESVGGGLLEGHLFQKRPPMQQVCTACHGSRIGKEYLGKNKGLKPDVHKEKYFKCNKCHTAEEMHGSSKAVANRYEVENGPKCLDCHTTIYDATSENVKNHWIHKDQVSCQVCHSQAYKTCYGCHFGKDKQGFKFYKTTKSDMQFKIGLNPLKSTKRPETFVTVRHIPVDMDSFKFYVDNGLKNFDRLPTWKFATPHNIRRQTPQNKTCNACHGNTTLFLQNTDVEKKYLNANKPVIVPMDRIPKKRRNE
jgi:thiosulfate/3-mercaptopyruvate sulfurtransferase